MSAKMDKVLNGVLAKGTAALLMSGLVVAGTAVASEVKFKSNGGLQWETADGEAKGQIGGRIHIDTAHFDDDVVNHETGVQFRRVRLFTQAYYMGYEAKIQIDYEDGDLGIEDLYIATKAMGGQFKFGHFQQPFGLEALTSSKYITFVERGFASNSIGTGRKVGINYHRHTNNTTFSASFYDPAGIQNDDKSDYDAKAFGFRATWAPHADKGNITHLGFAAAQETDNLDVTYKAKPEVNAAASTTLLSINSPNNDVDATKFGIEGALVRGPFSVQAEYQTSNVDGNGTDETLNSFYLYGSYFLTGDARAYKTKDGKFDRVKPASKSGAWEIGLRYDNAENDDRGAEAEAITAGVNYYATSHLRYMLNLIKADMTDGGVTDSPTAVVARVSVDF